MFKIFWFDIVLLNLKSYENIGIDFQINVFLFFVALMFCVFAFYIERTRGRIQLLVSQLKRHKAYSSDTAKTLRGLGLKESLRLRMLIKNNRMLSRLIERTDRKEYTYEEYTALKPSERKKVDKIDFETEKFYIRPESSSRVDDICVSYGFSLVRLLVVFVFIMMIYVALACLSPEILRIIDNNLKPETVV